MGVCTQRVPLELWDAALGFVAGALGWWEQGMNLLPWEFGHSRVDVTIPKPALWLWPVLYKMQD